MRKSIFTPVNKMPRKDTKVRPDSFIMDYVSTLQIYKNLNGEMGGKERALSDNRLAKNRTLVVYVDTNSNTWNTPLMDKIDEATTTYTSGERIDLTKDETETTTSTDTISQLSHDLAFLRKEFNDSIQITNKNRDDENTAFMAKISTVQKPTDTFINDLTDVIKSLLITQDKVINSFKDGQVSMDNRMATVTDNVQK